MSKIVIIAPSDASSDVDDAAKLLKAAGHEVDIQEPTPKTLLHIVLGLMGPNAYGFGPGYAYTPGSDAADDLPPGDELPVEDELTSDDPLADLDGQSDLDIPAAEGGDDDFNFEGLTVDGEPLVASKIDSDHSVLVVTELHVGPKTSYKLNESKFSFWPADLQKPMQRVDVGREKWHTSLEVEVQLGEKAELRVGKDLADMFEAK